MDQTPKKKMRIKIRGNNPLLASRNPRLSRGVGAARPSMTAGGIGGEGSPRK
jgi:hypothetical protein